MGCASCGQSYKRRNTGPKPSVPFTYKKKARTVSTPNPSTEGFVKGIRRNSVQLPTPVLPEEP